MIRTFIAVETSPEVRAAAAGMTDRLKQGWRVSEVRWVPPESLHLTLRFLGETEEAGVAPLTAALDAVTAGTPPCRLTLGPLGAFPDARRPRVLWLGLKGADTAALRSLQGRIEERVTGLGWDHEGRPFSPHLTLGRVRPGMRADPGAGWTRAAVPELAFPVDEVVLMGSDLRPDGPHYSVLHRSPLGGHIGRAESHGRPGPAIPQRTGAGGPA